jgi:hypothetical protein
MKLAEMGNRLAKNKLEEKLGEPLGVGLFVYCSLQTIGAQGQYPLNPRSYQHRSLLIGQPSSLPVFSNSWRDQGCQ